MTYDSSIHRGLATCLATLALLLCGLVTARDTHRSVMAAGPNVPAHVEIDDAPAYRVLPDPLGPYAGEIGNGSTLDMSTASPGSLQRTLTLDLSQQDNDHFLTSDGSGSDSCHVRSNETQQLNICGTNLFPDVTIYVLGLFTKRDPTEGSLVKLTCSFKGVFEGQKPWQVRYLQPLTVISESPNVCIVTTDGAASDVAEVFKVPKSRGPIVSLGRCHLPIRMKITRFP